MLDISSRADRHSISDNNKFVVAYGRAGRRNSVLAVSDVAELLQEVSQHISCFLGIATLGSLFYENRG